MKSWPIALISHNAGRVTTLAYCFKATRRDGQVFGFTNHQRDITGIPDDSTVYARRTGFNASEIETTAALNVDDMEIEGMLDSAGITNDDILAGLWDFAEIEIFVVNYKDTSMGKGEVRRGNLGEIKRSRSIFVAELRGMMQRLQQRVGRECTAACPWKLGSVECGVDLDTFTDGKVTTTVTTPVSQREFIATALTQAATWFDNGTIEFNDGANAGVLREIKAHTSGGNIVTQLTFPYPIQAGDEFTATVGCLHRRDEDCEQKFDNVVSANPAGGGFGGFPDVPGRNRIMSGL